MNLITNLLTLHNQLKVYHWQTRSYAAHIAFGGAYDVLTLLIDQFIEVYQGKNGLLKAQNNFTITLRNLNGDEDVTKFIEAFLDGVGLRVAIPFIIPPYSMAALTVMYCSFFATWKACFTDDEVLPV